MVKILLIVAVLLSVGSGVLGFLNKTKLDSSKSELAAARVEVENRGNRITELQGTLETTQSELATTTARANEAEMSLETVRTELSAANNKANSLENLLENKNMEIEMLKGEIASLREKDPEEEAPEQLAQAAAVTTELAQMKEQLAAAEMEARLMAEQLESAQSRVRSLEQEAARREGQMMAKGLQGQIVAVNPAWNFVVLSLGDRQGVAPNAEMLVRRGDRMIGKVRVTSVERSNSIADIVSGSVPTGVSIQAGDVVIYSGLTPES